MNQADADSHRRNLREAEPETVLHGGYPAVFNAEGLLETLAEDGLDGRVLIEMDIVVAAHGTQIGEGGQVVLAFINNHARVRGVQLGIVLGKAQDLYLSLVVIYREADDAFFLDGALCYSEQQPGLSVHAEYAGVQQAGDFHAGDARLEV